MLFKRLENYKTNEFKILKYEINRVCLNRNIQAYLWNLHHFAEKTKTKTSFDEIINYAKKESCFQTDPVKFSV